MKRKKRFGMKRGASSGLQTKTIPLEVKADGDSRIKGYASVFGVLDHDGDIIVKGAFADTLKKRFDKGLIRVLWQHDMTDPIGVPDVLREDSRGLYFEASLAVKVRKIAEYFEMIKSGLVNRTSIGFNTMAFETFVDEELAAQLPVWRRDYPLRKLTKLELIEFSPVTFASNEETEVVAAKRGKFWHIPTPDVQADELFAALASNFGEFKSMCRAVESKMITTRAVADWTVGMVVEWQGEGEDAEMNEGTVVEVRPASDNEGDDEESANAVLVVDVHDADGEATGDVVELDEALVSLVGDDSEDDDTADEEEDTADEEDGGDKGRDDDSGDEGDDSGADAGECACPHCGKSIQGETKAGRVLSGKNFDKLVEARDAIDGVIASAKRDDGEGKGKAAAGGDSLVSFAEGLKGVFAENVGGDSDSNDDGFVDGLKGLFDF